jgi:predicted nucleotide-binding protein
MPRKRSPDPQPAEPELLVSREEAAKRIDERMTAGEQLRQREITAAEVLEECEADYRRWNSFNAELLKRLFTTAKYAEEYSWWGVASVSRFESPLHQKIREYRDEIAEKLHRLQSIRERLDLIPLAASVAASSPVAAARAHSNRVFVVHGHDEAARESVARFLEKLGVGAIILHEQPTGGRTLMEKLEHYSDVDFAVILLTPDDVGAVGGTGAPQLQPRARQNVVLELGYFVGKLDREHVCALYSGPLELPSDYLGVGFVPLDRGGGWRLQLARELRAAGVAVDMNLAL